MGTVGVGIVVSGVEVVGEVMGVVGRVVVSGTTVVVSGGGLQSEVFTGMVWARKSLPLFRLTSTEMVSPGCSMSGLGQIMTVKFLSVGFLSMTLESLNLNLQMTSLSFFAL